jgi:chemotaxis protein CheX
VDFPSDALRNIATHVWLTLFQTDLLPVEITEDEFAKEDLAGIVHISGAWEGEVTVQCPTALARQLAAQMFAMAPEDLSQEEIRDALGEITNVCGGNLKAILPGPSQLSLPSIVSGSDYSLHVLGHHIVQQVGFRCDGAPLMVTVFQPDKGRAGIA